MEIIRCENGHFYNAQSSDVCPVCGCGGSPELPAPFQDEGPLTLISRGSVGAVYRTAKGNALKVISCDGDFIRFLNAQYEAAIMTDLRSTEHTIQILDSYLDPDRKRVWILEELGDPLTDYLAAHPVSSAWKLHLAADLCQGLAEIRARGILHLDIQPKNLFITPQGTVKIGDFSSALRSADLSGNKDRRGTPLFMAPEVYHSRRCSEQSDIYSVGLLLYFLFHKGKLPFEDGCSQSRAMELRVNGMNFPAFSHGSPEFSEMLQGLIRAACAFDPQCRIQSFENLGRGLTALLPLADTSDEAPFFSPSQENPKLAVTAPLCSTAPTSGSPFFDSDEMACTTILTAPSCPTFDATAAPSESFPMPDLCCPSPSFGRSSASGKPASPPPPMPNASCSMPDPGSSPPRSGPKKGILGGFPSFGRGQSTKPASTPAPASLWPFGKKKQAPELTLSKVQFSALAPETLVPGKYALIDIYMYEEAFRRVVDQAIANSKQSLQEKRSGTLKVQEGTQIRITLSSPDLEIQDGDQTQIWQGEYLSFNFSALLPRNFPGDQVLFNAVVYFNGVIATQLKFLAACGCIPGQPFHLNRKDIFSAFVSYASEDRSRVAAIIQGMKKARPDLDIFFDVESLRSGEDWESALYREIDNRDILYLCWSHFARMSAWVEAEWRYAMDRKGIDCIEPIPMESPKKCPPPMELQKKHFNDKLLYIIDGEL